MVGFITARLTQLAESDPKDRALLGLSGAAADRQRAVYILTLGTVPALRQQVTPASGRPFKFRLFDSQTRCLSGCMQRAARQMQLAHCSDQSDGTSNS